MLVVYTFLKDFLEQLETMEKTEIRLEGVVIAQFSFFFL